MLGVFGWGWARAAQVHAALYGRGILRRRRLDRPVISVGALTAGGAGKTPTVALLAALLGDAGHRTAILSRGYRRRSRGPLLVSRGDGAGPMVSADAAGDEPYWLAQVLPGVSVAVGERRDEAAAVLLADHDVDVFLLDDGFQHHRIFRDADLVLVNPEAPFWEDSPLPSGSLRESVAAVARADALVVVATGTSAAKAVRAKFPGHTGFSLAPMSPGAWPLGSTPPVVTTDALGAAGNGATRPPASVAAAELPGQPTFAFAGIARPQRFLDGLTAAGVQVVGSRTFPDHHRYTDADLAEIDAAARAAGADLLLTTEKDAVRLPAGALHLPTYVCGYRLAAADPAALLGWLQERSGLTPPRSAA